MRAPSTKPDLRAHLTPRETEVMYLVTAGRLDKEIAFSLGICLQTVKNILYNVYGKMNVSNRIEATIVFRDMGEIEDMRA